MATTFRDAFDQAFADLGFDDEGTPEPGPEPDEAPEAADEAPEETEGPASSEDGEAETDDDEDPDEEPEDDAEPTEALEVPEGATIRLPDGTTLTSEELSKGVLLQRDYTRKTQELADQRRELEGQTEQLEELASFRDQVETWYSEKASNPVEWIAEIAVESGDATAAVARVIKSLAEQGALDPEFVETFGLTSGKVADRAAKGAEADRISRVERELQERREAEAQAQQQQQIAADYRSQWQELKATNSLAFDSVDAEREAGVELLQFAVEREITDLRTAYAALQWEKAQSAPAEPAKKQPDPAVAQRKRANRAITPRSAGGAERAAPKAKTPRSAAELALDQFAARQGA